MWMDETSPAPATPEAPVTTAPETPAASEKTTETSAIPTDERTLAAIGYIPMLFVAPLIMKPGSAFCQLHGKQSLVITMGTFAVLIILVIIPAIGSLLFLGLIGLIAISAFQANNGVAWKIPFLYEISSKLNIDQLFAGTSVKPTETQPTEKPTTNEASAESASTPPASESQQ